MDSEPMSTPSTPEDAPVQIEAAVLTNRCRFDADTLRIAYRRNARRWCWIQYLCVAVIAAMAVRFTIRCIQALPTIILLLKDRNSTAGSGVLLLVLTLAMYAAAIFYLVRALRAPEKGVRRRLQQLEETHHVSSFETINRLTAAEFLGEASISADLNRISYADVKRLVPCQRLILVYTQAKQFLILDRTRFENGTEADFWKLMSEKCPKAVPKKYR